jgi:hypothetical protein
MNKSNVPQLKFEEFLYNWGTTKKVPLEAKFSPLLPEATNLLSRRFFNAYTKSIAEFASSSFFGT